MYRGYQGSLYDFRQLYDVDVTNTELNDEGRATILNLLTEARNRAFECGCDKIAEAVDALRIEVVLKQPKVNHIRDEVDKLKETAKSCLNRRQRRLRQSVGQHFAFRIDERR